MKKIIVYWGICIIFFILNFKILGFIYAKFVPFNTVTNIISIFIIIFVDIPQDCNNRQVLEVGYLFQKKFWHKGYASEAAIACKEYAFEILNADEVFSIIRDTNIASQNVAKRNGMSITDRFIKHYYGVDMPHLVFRLSKEVNLKQGGFNGTL